MEAFQNTNRSGNGLKLCEVLQISFEKYKIVCHKLMEKESCFTRMEDKSISQMTSSVIKYEGTNRMFP